MTMRLTPFVLFLLAAPAFAQDQAIQRELIGRQQQLDRFALQLHQSQQLLKVPGNLGHRQQIEARHLAERERLESVSERQLREVKPDTPQELRAYERYKADEERRPLTVPAEQAKQI